tara:strand:- start:426 stop:680 length:255 start_codon:yes stop_codon:yes gene_type:complete
MKKYIFSCYKMEKLIEKSEQFKRDSLKNVFDLALGKTTVPVAGCSQGKEGNPSILSRCQYNRIYNQRSEIVPEIVPGFLVKNEK